MAGLRIAEDLTLPLEFVTQATAILARRRAGKSYTAARLVEEIFSAGQQVVIIDPKGDWWGLRSSADGAAPGLPILILGGEHGDLPLEPGAGETLAQLVVEEGVSVLLDLSQLRRVPAGKDQPSALAGFGAAFLETLYRLKARDHYRTPLLLVIDEADIVAPQRLRQKGDAAMLGAADDIVRRGGQRGLGCLLVSQRAAAISKDLLSQIEVLIALRTVAPQDLDAVGGWIDVHGTPEQRRALLGSLPSLPVGTAWFWSPGWPTDAGIFQRARVGRRATYDSGATPRVGEARRAPRRLADVDLGALRERMAATIARARADDPRELRRRIAELERRLRERPAAVRVETVVERVEVPVPIVDRGDLDRLRGGLDELRTGLERAALLAADLSSELDTWERRLAEHQARPAPGGARPEPGDPPPTRRPAPPRPAATDGADAVKLTGGERKVLTVLAQYAGGRTKVQLAIMTGYAVNGGGYNNILSGLRTKGFMTGSNQLAIADAGRAALGAWEPLPAGRALLDHWLGQLGKAERAVLAALYDVYPRALDKASLGAATGYEPTGGGFNNALSRLRTLELIAGRGELQASEVFFEESMGQSA